MRITQASWTYQPSKRISEPLLMNNLKTVLTVEPSLKKNYLNNQLFLMGTAFNRLDRGTSSREDRVCRAAWGISHDLAFMINGWGDAEGLKKNIEQNRKIILKLVPKKFATKKNLKKLILKAKDIKLDERSAKVLKEASIDPKTVNKIFENVSEGDADVLAEILAENAKKVAYKCEACGHEVTIAECKLTKVAILLSLSDMPPHVYWIFWMTVLLYAYWWLDAAYSIRDQIPDWLGFRELLSDVAKGDVMLTVYLICFIMLPPVVIGFWGILLTKGEHKFESFYKQGILEHAPVGYSNLPEDSNICAMCRKKICYGCVRGVDASKKKIEELAGAIYCNSCSRKFKGKLRLTSTKETMGR